MKMTFQSRVHTSAVHPAVDMSVTFLSLPFSIQLFVLFLWQLLSDAVAAAIVVITAVVVWVHVVDQAVLI